MRFEVDLLSIVDGAQRQREIERYSARCADVPVRHIEGDYLLAGQLERRKLSDYAAVLILSSDLLETAEEADARVVVGHRLVHGLIDGLDRPPRVLVELADAANEGLVVSGSAETLVSPILLSHVLARVALNPPMRLVFDELFTEGGAEIAFRAPRADEAGAALRFAELEARAARRGETLLGVHSIDPPPGEPALALNPDRQRTFELSDGDRLCVLTTKSGR
jgi:hypothetical protein